MSTSLVKAQTVRAGRELSLTKGDPLTDLHNLRLQERLAFCQLLYTPVDVQLRLLFHWLVRHGGKADQEA